MIKEETIRVLVADDHEIYRDGLRVMLKKQPDIEWVGEAENGQEVIKLVGTLKPHVVLMDIMMPVTDGIAATRALREFFPAVKVIALSMFNDDNLIVDMLEAGAKGYLLKNAEKKEILEAIKSVRQEKPYYCSSTSTRLAQLIGRSKYDPFERELKQQFSDKELEIIRLICKEFSNKEIAERLFISTRTVEGYRLKIQEKIKVRNVTGIVIYAVKHGIFVPE
jgi:DNA-binding NarL/FixJ family response regulator